MAGRNECSKCGLLFGSLGAFDMHRTGSCGDPIYAPKDVKRKNPVGYTKPTRRCLTLDEITALGMKPTTRPDGEVWWIIGTFDGTVFQQEKAEDMPPEEISV